MPPCPGHRIFLPLTHSIPSPGFPICLHLESQGRVSVRAHTSLKGVCFLSPGKTGGRPRPSRLGPTTQHSTSLKTQNPKATPCTGSVTVDLPQLQEKEIHEAPAWRPQGHRVGGRVTGKRGGESAGTASCLSLGGPALATMHPIQARTWARDPPPQWGYIDPHVARTSGREINWQEPRKGPDTVFSSGQAANSCLALQHSLSRTQKSTHNRLQTDPAGKVAIPRCLPHATDKKTKPQGVGQ